MTGLSVPARAQWDLGNSSAVDSINSGGTGDLGSTSGLGSPHSSNGGLSINQAYNTGSNAMMPNQTPTQYDQRGGQQNVWVQNQNWAAQAVGQQLMPASTRRLSLMQYGALPGGLRGVVNGLPPTSLDSFVRNAGGHAEAIYGDEGTDSWPRLSGFGRGNTINAGIVGQRSKTLTTGHSGEKLPTASGNGNEKTR